MVEQALIDRAELQTRYLLAGHPDQWPSTWHTLSPATATAGLVKQAQRALSFVRLVGVTGRLKAFLEATDELLGVAPAGHVDADGEANITPVQWLSPAEFAHDFGATLRDATRADRVPSSCSAWWLGPTTPVTRRGQCRTGNSALLSPLDQSRQHQRSIDHRHLPVFDWLNTGVFWQIGQSYKRVATHAGTTRSLATR